MDAHRQIGLDALRGVAILCVLLFHFDQPVGIAAVDAALSPFRSGGWAGVELFFVLSGFLVGGMILRESASTGAFDWRRFMLRRAFRLWPILYLYIAFMAIGGVDWSSVWPVLLHVQNYGAHSRSHLWSLAVEEHFYILAAIALPWFVRTLPPRRLPGMLVGVIVVVNLLRLVAVANGATWDAVHWQTQFRVDALAAGVLLAVAMYHRPAAFAAAQRHRALLVLGAAAGFAVVALKVALFKRWSFDLTVAWLAAVPLVVAAQGLPIRGVIAGPARILAAVGRIAYPLYVWHISAGNIAALIVQDAGVANPAAIMFARYVGAIGIALLLHRLVELPFIAVRERIGRSDKPPTITALA